jgi:hypothetical protein
MNVLGFAIVLSDIPSDNRQQNFQCSNKSGISEFSTPSTQTLRLQSSNMIEIRTAYSQNARIQLYYTAYY